MEKGILEKTGKPLEHWMQLVLKSKIDKHKEIIEFLKSKHNLSYGYANFIALKAKKSDAGSIADDDLLSGQYKGKENLMPIYEQLISKISKLGDDITITPKKDSVSIIRKKQFALIKPATKTRIDLGLKIKDKPIAGRLENSGPFGSMCSHRVQIASPNEVDSEVQRWLKEAYDGAQ